MHNSKNCYYSTAVGAIAKAEKQTMIAAINFKVC